MTDRRIGVTMSMVSTLGLVAVGCSSPTSPPPETPRGATGPGFSIAFENGNSRTVVPGEVLQLNLLIQRDEGFEGAIELSSSDAPGIVVIFRPGIVLHRDDSDLLLVAEQSTQRRTHQIEFSAQSPGHSTKTTTLALTVVDSK